MQMHRQVDMALDDIYVTLNASIKRPLVRGLLSSGLILSGPDGSALDWHDSPRGLPSWRVDPTNRLSEFQTEMTTDEGGLDIEALYARNPHWVLLGDPGSGKTTLLRHQAWKSADDHLSGRGAVLPVYLTLRYFDPKSADNVDSALFDYATGPNVEDLGFAPEECRPWRAEIVQALAESRALILCDGLDEQRDAGVKARTVAAIESLVHAHPDYRCMVTSRIVGYDAAPLRRGFETATLEPFSEEQVRAFFRKWYRAVEKAENLIEAYTEVRADRKADEMTDAVLSEANPGLRRLAANPLLCTIIGLIHRQGGALPEQRVELYKLCVDTFIFNWEMHKRRRKEEQGGLNPQETQEVLEPIAFHLQEETVENRAPREKILGWAAGFLLREHGMPEPEARTKAGRPSTSSVTSPACSSTAAGGICLLPPELPKVSVRPVHHAPPARDRKAPQASAGHLRPSAAPLQSPVARGDLPRRRLPGPAEPRGASEFVDLVARQTDLMPHEAEMRYAFRMAFACLRQTRVLVPDGGRDDGALGPDVPRSAASPGAPPRPPAPPRPFLALRAAHLGPLATRASQ